MALWTRRRISSKWQESVAPVKYYDNFGVPPTRWPAIRPSEIIREEMARHKAITPGQSVAVVDPPVLPDPQTPESELDALEREEYLKVAKELGFCNKAVRVEKLDGFLVQHGIKVYETARVEGFLSGITPRGSVWGWKPLRKKDKRVSDQEYPFVSKTRDGDIWGQSLYQRKVPLQALTLIRDIETGIPAQDVQFYVSDYEVKEAMQPDPFLAVIPCGTDDIRVIFHWDEPGFKG